MIGHAVELLPPGADRTDREAWLAARRDGISASDMAAILGLSRWNSPLALYFRKRGDLDEEDANPRMDLGIALEPYVAAKFTDMTGLDLEQSAGLLANAERPWQRCTPDRLISGSHIPCELKTAVSEDDWGYSGSDVVPLYYRCQLLYQCDVLGADHGYMAVIFLRSGEPRWYRIGWDGEDIAVMREAGLEFLRRVEEGDPPAADGSDATTTALRRRYGADPDLPGVTCSRGLRRSYIAAIKARKAADTRHQEISNKIRQLMGEATRLSDPDGGIVATRRGPKGALYPGKDLMG